MPVQLANAGLVPVFKLDLTRLDLTGRFARASQGA